MKTKREIQDQVNCVAAEVVRDFWLQDPSNVHAAHVDTAYIRLWEWDRRAVEMMTDSGQVRHAIEVAVADFQADGREAERMEEARQDLSDMRAARRDAGYRHW